MRILWQEVRYAARVLARSPAFTIIAVLSLAIGIGVNTAVFSAFNAVSLRELPVRAPGELHVLNWTGLCSEERGYRIAGEEVTALDAVRMRLAMFSYPM
jgi:hypothetical protein